MTILTTAFLTLLTTVSWVAAAETVPYGHPDFYPSPERPVGWRGDGSGAWPGATAPAKWEVAWKTAMPGPSFSQPIVVGDKVFALADPNWMVCLSARDGRILWQTAMDHSTKLPAEDRAKFPEVKAFWDDIHRLYVAWRWRRGPAELLARADKAAEEYQFTKNNPGQANYEPIPKSKHPLAERRAADTQRYGLNLIHPWDDIMTGTFATPVSDGEHVFAIGSNDQIACFDLNGKLVWLVVDRVDGKRPAALQCYYAMSPLLSGDLVIVAMNGYLRAYDKRTGERRWVSAKDRNLAGYHSKVGSPVLMRLLAGNEKVDVICATGAGIFRVADGKKIGDLPGLAGYEGSTALVAGDVLVRQGAPDSGTRGIFAHRLIAKSRDAVVLEEVWRQEGKEWGGNTTAVVHDGRVYRPYDGNWVDIKTGATGKIGQTGRSNISPILAGQFLFGVAGGGVDKRSDKRKPYVAVLSPLTGGPVTTITDAFPDTRYDTDDEYFLNWRFRANDGVNSSPSAQGNRLFFRTVGYLWSIGGKDWFTPKTAPAAAQVR